MVDYLIVFFQHLGKDENVIQVYNHDSFYYEIPKDIIYHNLECDRTVYYAEKHYKRFKKTMVSIKDSLSLINRLDVDIVESPAYV